MAHEIPLLKISLEAAEDLSSHQYHFVMRDATSGKARLPDAEDEAAEGILQNNPAAGQEAEIMVDGISKCVANAALASGKFVKHEYVAAADAGKADDAGTLWDRARGIVLEAAGAEDDLCSVRLIGPFPWGRMSGIKKTTVSTLTTADDLTLTAAQLLGGFIDRDPNGGARTDTTPTAALLIAAIIQAGVGNSFEFTIKNSADGAETITIGAGTGVTLTGTMTIAQNNSKRFLAVVTAADAVTIYSLGTVVH